MAVQTNVNKKSTSKQSESHEVENTQGLFGKALDDIKLKKANVEERIEQLRKAGESATRELRAGLEMAWDDLRLSLESALNQFSHMDDVPSEKTEKTENIH